MPTYQYSCTECGHFLEEKQAFSDDPLTVCPECGGRLRKVFGAVGVVFKGSGFYRTDSRGKDPASSGSTSDSGSSSTTEKKSEKKDTSAASTSSGSGSASGSGSSSGTSGSSTTSGSTTS